MEHQETRGHGVRPPLRHHADGAAGTRLSLGLDVIPYLLSRRGRAGLRFLVCVFLGWGWLFRSLGLARAADASYTGAPLNLAKPTEDSYDWASLVNFNFGVINSSFSTLGAATGTVAGRVTTLEVWQGTMTPAVTTLQTDSAALSVSTSNLASGSATTYVTVSGDTMTGRLTAPDLTLTYGVDAATATFSGRLYAGGAGGASYMMDVKGADTSSSLYAFRARDSADTTLLDVRNDGVLSNNSSVDGNNLTLTNSAGRARLALRSTLNEPSYLSHGDASGEVGYEYVDRNAGTTYTIAANPDGSSIGFTLLNTQAMKVGSTGKSVSITYGLDVSTLSVSGGATASSITALGMGLDTVGGQSFATTPSGHGRLYGLSGKGITLQGETGSTVQWSILEAGGGLYHAEGTSGALRLMPDSGNIIVGSRNTPDSSFHVERSATVGEQFYVGTSSGGSGTGWPGKVSIISQDTTVRPAIAIRHINNSNYGFDFDSEQNSVGRLDLYGVVAGSRGQLMSWKRDGSGVGIGTTSPGTNLHIHGTSPKLRMSMSNNGGEDHIEFVDNASNVVFSEYVSDSLYTWNLVRHGVTTMTVTNAGNFGFGTVNPATKVDVEGSAQFGSGATKSTFSATGVLTMVTGYSPSTSLEVATKGYVDTTVGAGATVAVVSTGTPSGSGTNTTFTDCIAGSTITLVMTGGSLACGYQGAISNTSGTGVAWAVKVNGAFFAGHSSTKGFFTHLNSLSSTGTNAAGVIRSTGTYTGTISACLMAATNSGTWVIPSASAIGFTDQAQFFCEENK